MKYPFSNTSKLFYGLILFLLIAGCGILGQNAEPTAAPPTEGAAPTAQEAATVPAEAPPAEVQPTAPPAGPVFTVLGVANRDPSQSGLTPMLASGATTAGNPPSAWLAWAENSSGNARQIFVSELTAGSLQARGASLNLHVNVQGIQPALAFAGENNSVPWSVWVEPSPGFNNVPNIFASKFNPATGLWQVAGQDRGGGEPSLNLRTNRPASSPVIAGGSGDPAVPPVPWVAWEELSNLTNFTQIFVSKGVKDETGIGGFIWQPVGELRHADQPTLNIDSFRNAQHPSMVFAETSNAVPWVTWHESGADRPSRIYSARGVADAKVPGGFKWIVVPACEPDETACATNVNPLKDAKDASMAAGSVTPGEATVPWIAWAEIGPSGKWQIFVSRLDPASRASFINVGGSLNVEPNNDARSPVMVFLGNVPYVAWLEDNGSGNFVTHLRHLASDPQTGTWVLDSPTAGFDQDAAQSNSALAAAASQDAIFLAWVEGDPSAQITQIILSQLIP